MVKIYQIYFLVYHQLILLNLMMIMILLHIFVSKMIVKSNLEAIAKFDGKKLWVKYLLWKILLVY